MGMMFQTGDCMAYIIQDIPQISVHPPPPHYLKTKVNATEFWEYYCSGQRTFLQRDRKQLTVLESYENNTQIMCVSSNFHPLKAIYIAHCDIMTKRNE